MTYSWCLRVVTVLCIVGLMAVSCNANVFIETAGENQTMSPVLSLEDTNNTNSIGSVSPLDTQQSLTEMPSSLSPKEIAATEAQTRDRINGFSGTSDDDLMSQGLGIITSDPNPVSPSDVRSREEIVASESHVRAIMSEATIQRPKVDDFSVITNSPTYHVVSTPSPEEIASMEAQVKELLVDSYFQGAAPEGFSIATSVPLSGEGLNLTPDEIGASESYIKEQLEGSTLQSPIPEGFSIATSTPPSGEGTGLTPEENAALESRIKEQLEGSTLQSPVPEGFSIATSTPPSGEGTGLTPEEIAALESRIKEQLEGSTQRETAPEGYTVMTSSLVLSEESLNQLSSPITSDYISPMEGDFTTITYDQMINGTLSVAGELDNYSFMGSIGDQIVIRLDSSWSSYPQIQLYFGNGTLLTQTYLINNVELSYTLPETGQFRIVIMDREMNDIGTYSLYLTKLNPPPSSTPIPLGHTITGNFTRPLEMISYSFTTGAEESIRVLGSGSTLAVVLYNSSGIQIPLTDPTCLNEPGNYYLIAKMKPEMAPGSYGLYLESLINPGTITYLSYNESITASISNITEMDLYSFTGSDGDKIIVRYKGWYHICGPSTVCGSIAKIIICHANGTFITSQSSSVSGEITTQLPESGSYLIIFQDSGNDETGTYTLYLTKLNPPPAATPVPFGQTKSGNITRRLEMIPYSFEASMNETIRVLKNGKGFDVRLLNSAGNQIPLTDQTRINESGTYYLVLITEIGGFSDYSIPRPYSLFIESFTTPSSVMSISYDQAVTATISNTSEIDLYSFTGSTGDQILIRWNGWRHQACSWGSCGWYPTDATVSLCTLNGSCLKSQSSMYGDLTYLLPESGPYFIIFQDTGTDEVGTYSLYLTKMNPPPTVFPISLGQPRMGNFTRLCEIIPYNFTISSDDIIRVLGSGYYNNNEIRLYNSSGIQLSLGDPTTLIGPGLYYLVASMKPESQFGPYGLYVDSLTHSENITPLKYNQSVTTSINNEAEMDLYSFSGSEGDQVLIRLDTAWSSYAHIMIFYGNGTFITQDYKYNNLEVTVFLPVAGDYIIVVQDKDTNNVGTYSLFLTKLNPPSTITPIHFGQTILNNFTSPLEIITYSFTAESNEPIRVFGSGSSLELRLFNSSWIQLPLTDPTILTESGTYYLIAAAKPETSPGPYGIYLESLTNPGNVTPLSYDQSITAAINNTAEMDLYSFTGSAGDQILARLDGSWNYAPQILLYYGNGTFITQHYDYGYRENPITYNLPESGTYLIVVQDKDTNDIGTYSLYLTKLNPPPTVTPILFGQTILSNFTRPQEMIPYSFTAAANETIRVFGSGSSLEVRLYNSSGIQIPLTDPTRLAEPGTYYLIATVKVDTTPGPYGLYLEALTNPGTVTPISYDQSISAAINNTAEMDLYSFTGTVGDQILARLDGSWYNAPQILLYHGNGTFITQHCDYSHRENPITYKLPETGTYLIVVQDWDTNDIGTYSLYLTKLNPPPTVTPIPFGQTILSNFTRPQEMIPYSFTAAANETIRVFGSGSSLEVRLYNSSGIQLSLTDPKRLTESGTYYLVAAVKVDTSPGPYGLYLESLTNPGNVTPLSYDQSITAAINNTAEMDLYSFTGVAGDQILARLDSAWSYNPQIRLYFGNGTYITQYSDYGFRENAITYRLPESGSYLIVVQDRETNDIGAYSLFLTKLNPPPTVTPIPFGQMVLSNFTRPMEVIPYSFTASANETIRVFGSGSSLEVRLYNSSGIQLSLTDPTRLTEPGIYYLVAAVKVDTSPGPYGLYLESLTNPGNVTPLSYDQSINAAINNTAEMDLYSFTGAAGDLVTVQAHSSWYYGPDVRLFFGNGTFINRNYGGYDIKTIYRLPINGKYYISVEDYNHDHIGNYSLSLQGRSPVSINFGMTYSSTITQNEWHDYYIDCSAGEEMVIKLTPSSSTPEFELYASFNRLPDKTVYDYAQFEKSAGGTYDIIISPTSSGRYYIAVYGKTIATSAGYTLSVSTGGRYISNAYPRVVTASNDVLLSIYGVGFEPGMSVELNKNLTPQSTVNNVFLSSPTILLARFNLSSIPVDTYDLHVRWPDSEEIILPSSIEVRELGEGILYQKDDLSLAGGSTFVYSLGISDSPNIFITLKKHRIWDATISVTDQNGTVVKSDRSSKDQIIQIPNPDPGPYTVTINAGNTGTGIFTICTDLPKLPPGEWVVDTIYHQAGFTFRQVEVPPGQDALIFNAQAMGLWSYFSVYRGEWGTGQQWISSSGQYASLTIPHPEPGLYIVRFLDSANVWDVDQTRDVLLRASTIATVDPLPSYLPSISSITPLEGGNTGMVSLIIKGAWLDPNATVSLDQNSNPVMSALSVAGTQDKNSLSATFDLTGKTPGSYNVTVTNPDNTQVLGPSPFVIDEGGRSEFWVELVGREILRVGRPATYVLKYGNRGTLDMPAPLIAIVADPVSDSAWIRFPPSTDKFPMNRIITVATMGTEERPDILPAGSSFSREFEVTGSTVNELTLSVIPYSSDPLFIPITPDGVMDAAAPSPGVPLVFGRVFQSGYSTYIGPFGYGWLHSYDLCLNPLADGNIGFNRGDGISILLLKKNSTTYIAEDGDLFLTCNGDGTSVLTLNSGDFIRFGANQKPISFTDANGNQLTLSYSEDRLTKIQHSDGDFFTINYTPQGRISTLTDHAGKVTSYVYNSDGNLLTAVTAPDGSVTNYMYEVETGMCNLIGITYPGGLIQNYRHDGEGRIVESSFNANRQPIQYSYDEESRITTIRNAGGMSTSLKVNENGKVVKVTDGVGNSFEVIYDQNEDPVRVTSPLGDTYQGLYDDDHNIVATINPLGHRVSYTYDSRFDLIDSITDPRGNTYNFDIDSKANLIGIIYPDSKTQPFAYDAQGNLIRTTTRKGDTINYQYTSQGLLARIDFPDNSFTTYTYDTAGNLLTVTNQNGTISIAYNGRNQPTVVHYPDGSSFTYTYDASGRLIRKAESSGYSTNFTYDDVGNLLRVTDGLGSVIVKYIYGPCGKIVRKDLRSGAYTTYAYDPAGRISRLVNYNATGSVLSRFDYEYDAIGNAVSVDTLDGRYQYEYDNLGQLLNVTYPDMSITRYTYDASGNRVSVITDTTSTSYISDTMNRYERAGTATFTYDANGNMISRTEGSNMTTYEYDYFNRLVRVASPEVIQEYLYDALGQRVGVRENGVLKRYVIDPMGIGNVVAEYAENGTLIARYEYGIGLVSKIDVSGIEYTYHFNPTGHTMEVTDPAGRIVNQYSYTPYGGYRQKMEGINNPFTYVGEYGVMDDGNNLHYMRLRSYSSDLGRFISEDPFGSGIDDMNWYSYCDNNPVTYIDPLGTDKIDVICGVVTIAAGVMAFLGLKEIGATVAAGLWGAWVGVNAFWDMARGGAMMLGGTKDPGSISEIIGKGMGGITGGDTGKGVDLGGSLIDIIKNGNWDKFKFYTIKAIKRLPKLIKMICRPVLEYIKKKLFPVKFVMSCDPEDKYGPIGYDSPSTMPENRQRFITGTDSLAYRIEFWNAENATANVNDVQAYDLLDSDLNLSTFGFTEVGFTNWSVPLEGAQSFDVYIDTRPSMNYFVHITGILNPDTGNLTLEYHTLDATTLEPPEDPVAGFLPPLSSNEYGWFAFSVVPIGGLSTGTMIENRAYVNFDYTQYFPAPPGGPWVNTIDAGAPSSSVSVALANGTEMVCTFSGSDDSGGAGIKDYTIFMSDNGGPYQSALNHVKTSPASLNGVPGHTYRFYSVARDNIGNTESAPAAPDSTLTIPIPSSMTIVSPNGGENYLQGSNRSIQWSYTGSPGPLVMIELLNGTAVDKVISSGISIGSGGFGSYIWNISSNQTLGSEFKIRITSTSDAACTDTSDAPFTISSGASLAVATPNGGETWQRGSIHAINWTYTGSPGSAVIIELLQGVAVNQIISSNTTIGSGGAGSYNWIIPYNQTPGTDYQIRITTTSNPACSDTSNAPFIIGPGSPITVVSPNGGDKWKQGSTQTLKWNYTDDPGSSVKIEVIKGSIVRVIAPSTSIGSDGYGFFNFTFPYGAPLGSDYQIRVTSTSNTSYTDTSDAPFAIIPPITVVSPNGGEEWQQGSAQIISWNYIGNPGPTVKIEALRGDTVLAVISQGTPIGIGGTGSFNLTLPINAPLGTDYRIRISSTSNAIYTDTSDAPFKITADTGSSIIMVAPNGGENYLQGSTQTIQWNYTGNPGAMVKIEALKGDKILAVVSPSAPIGSGGSGSYNLMFPYSTPLGFDYRIRVTSTSNPAWADTSEGQFTISPAITVTSPDGGENYPIGSLLSMSWTYAGNPGSMVNIDVLKGTTVLKSLNGIPIGSDGSGLFNVTLPASTPLGSDYKIRVTSASYSACTDMSNGTFTISAA